MSKILWKPQSIGSTNMQKFINYVNKAYGGNIVSYDELYKWSINDTANFWDSVWNWCKINWKFLVGFAIPCILLIAVNRRKAFKLLEKGIEFRKQQLDVAQRASDLESDGKVKNAKEFADRVEEVTTRHDEALRQLDDNAQARREELGGSDPARITEELADKFNLKNGDKK